MYKSDVVNPIKLLDMEHHFIRRRSILAILGLGFRKASCVYRAVRDVPCCRMSLGLSDGCSK